MYYLMALRMAQNMDNAREVLEIIDHFPYNAKRHWYSTFFFFGSTVTSL